MGKVFWNYSYDSRRFQYINDYWSDGKFEFGSHDLLGNDGYLFIGFL